MYLEMFIVLCPMKVFLYCEREHFVILPGGESIFSIFT